MSPAPAVVVAQLTDPHLRRDEPQRTRQLEATVSALLALGLPLAAVLVTGDIADEAHPDEYAAAVQALAPIELPLVVLGGNHDDRALLRAAFQLDGETAGPVRSTLTLPGLRIIACDTTIPGEDSGRVDVPWLAARLLDDHGTPTLIAMHHAPVPLGTPGIDDLGVPAADRRELARVLGYVGNVVGIVAGHVHRGTLSRIGRVPVVSAPSSNVQIAFDPLGAELALSESDPPALVLHTLAEGRLVSHIQPLPRVR